MIWKRFTISFRLSWAKLGDEFDSIWLGLFKFMLENSFNGFVAAIHVSHMVWLLSQKLASSTTILRLHTANILKHSLVLSGCFLMAYMLHDWTDSSRWPRQNALFLGCVSKLLSFSIWLSSFSLNKHKRPLSSSNTSKPYCSHTSSWRTIIVLSNISEK